MIATISLSAAAGKREELAAEQSSQKRLGSALFYGIVALLAYLTYLVFAPFLPALAWAIVLVVVSFPAYAWLAPRWGRTTAAVAATVGITLILIVPALLIAGAFIRQGVQAVHQIQLEVVSEHFRWVNALWTFPPYCGATGKMLWRFWPRSSARSCATRRYSCFI